MIKAKRQNRMIRFEYILPVLSPIVILVAWEVAVRIGALKPLFFPPPSLIVQTFYKLVVIGELQSHLWPTLFRIFAGFTLGALPGLILGLSMGCSQKIRLIMDPVISALYPIPKIAILPLIMLVFGIGEVSKLVVVGIGSFLLVAINTMTGVRSINRIYFEVAKNFGAGGVKTFTKVVLPGSLPMIFAGMRIALGMSLLLVVAVEFSAANNGIGVMIWTAWETLRTEILYVGVMICALLGLFFSFVLRRIERQFMPWEETIVREV